MTRCMEAFCPFQSTDFIDGNNANSLLVEKDFGSACEHPFCLATVYIMPKFSLQAMSPIWPVCVSTSHWWHLSLKLRLLGTSFLAHFSISTMATMPMLVALAALSWSTFALETPVKTCCPPGQFLAIEDWQDSRQSVEGIWFSQNPAGIIPLLKHPMMNTTQTSSGFNTAYTTIGCR